MLGMLNGLETKQLLEIATHDDEDDEEEATLMGS